MKLNPKLTGGLAWAGLIVVLAVPGADMLTKPQGETASRVAPQIDPVQTATITPAATNANDPVDSYISSGKKLPSYISDAPAEVASVKPAPTTKLVVPNGPATTAPAMKPATVAALPTEAAPTPYPASLRPRGPAAPAATSPLVTPPVATANATTEAPLIVDEELVARREEAVSRVLDQDVAAAPSQPRVVTSDELEEWDSGSLADYLERRNLISDGNSQASNSSADFDDDGFFLDEGPNEDRSRARVIRRLPRNSDFFLF